MLSKFSLPVAILLAAGAIVFASFKISDALMIASANQAQANLQSAQQTGAAISLASQQASMDAQSAALNARSIALRQQMTAQSIADQQQRDAAFNAALTAGGGHP